MMIGRVMYFGQSRIEIPAGVSEIGIAKITRGLFGGLSNVKKEELTDEFIKEYYQISTKLNSVAGAWFREKTEKQVDELTAQLSGGSGRRAFGILPRDW